MISFHRDCDIHNPKTYTESPAEAELSKTSATNVATFKSQFQRLCAAYKAKTGRSAVLMVAAPLSNHKIHVEQRGKRNK